MQQSGGTHQTLTFRLILAIGLIILFILTVSFLGQQAPPSRTPASATLSPSPTASRTPSPTATATPTPTLPPPTSTLANIRPQKMFTLGRGTVSTIARSPDGRLIAIIENNTTLKWFDAETYAQLGEVFIDDFPAGSVILSPDSRLAIVYSLGGGTLVDLSQQNQISISGGGEFVFSPDSKYIAARVYERSTGSFAEYINLWDVDQKKTIYLSPPTLFYLRDNFMSYPAISADSRLVAAGHSDSRVYVWNIEDGETRFILEGHAGEVASVDFSPDGRYLASGSADGTVRLWSPADGRLLRVITGLLDDVTGVKFSADSSRLHITVDEQIHQYYDLTSGQLLPLQQVAAIPDPFTNLLYTQGYLDGAYTTTHVVFSPDGSHLAVGRGNVQIWDISTQQLITAFDVPLNVTGMHYSPDGERLGVINNVGDVLVWETTHWGLILSLTTDLMSDGQPYYVNSQAWGVGRASSQVRVEEFAFSPDSSRLAVGIGATGEIWDIQNTVRLTRLELIQPFASSTRLAYSADGQRIYGSLNYNQGGVVWDATSGRLLSRFDLPSPTQNVFTTNDLSGSLFARNYTDAQGDWIEIWNLEEQSYLRFTSSGWDTEPLRFSPDGSLLFGMNNDRLFTWMSADGALIYQSVALGVTVEDLATNQGNTLMAISAHGGVEVWDIYGIADRAQGSFIPTVEPLPTDTPSLYLWLTETPRPPVPVTPLPSPDLPDDVISPGNAPKVAEVGRFGTGRIEQVSWVGDSRVLVTGSFGLEQYTLQAAGGMSSEPVSLATDLWVSSAVTHTDGRSLAAGTDGYRVQVWDLTSGETLADLEGGGEPALSPDGRLLVYLGEDSYLHIWDLVAGEPVSTLLCHARHPTFSPNGKQVAAVLDGFFRGSQDFVRVWDATSGVIVNVLGGPDNEITDLSFSPDGQRIVAAAGGSAWVWDIRPGQPAINTQLYPGEIDRNLSLYVHTVTAAALSPNGWRLAVGTSENTIGIYALGSQSPTRLLSGHSAAIEQLAFSPNGRFLLSLDADGAILSWNVSTGELLEAIYSHYGSIRGLTFQENGSLIGWQAGTTWTFDPAAEEVLHTTRITSGTILAVSPRGDWLAATYPYQVSLYDAVTGEFRQTLEGEAPKPFVEYYWEGQMFQGYHGAAFSLDGSVLVTLGSGGALIYDTQDGSLVRSIEGDNAQQADISADNRWLLSSLRVQTNPPAMYDLQSGENVFWLEGWGYTNIQYKISPDNRWVGVVARNEDGYQFQLWDFASHMMIQSLDFSPEIPLLSLAFSPDARLVALGQTDGQIFLLDLSTFQVVAMLSGHRGAVERLAFSPNGRYLASGGQDGTIRIWGVP